MMNIFQDFRSVRECSKERKRKIEGIRPEEKALHFIHGTVGRKRVVWMLNKKSLDDYSNISL